MKKHNKFTLLLLLSGVLAGCDSTYHAFDGESGYKFEALNGDSFAVQYYGNRLNSQKDVEVMWHHKARELCKGGAYQHHIISNQPLMTGKQVVMNAGLIPKGESHFLVDGEVSCLAPSLAIKLNQESEILSDKNLATHQLIGGSSSD